MLVVLLLPGWSGNSSRQNFSLLRKHLEMIPDLRVETIDYLDKEGKFTKLRTRKSVLEYADRAEWDLKRIINSYPEGTKMMAMGHSLGAIILRIFVLKGYEFEELIFAGGPFKGISRKFIPLLPLAAILRIKLFFELSPGSNFLKISTLPISGYYIGSRIDEVVPLESAIPKTAGKKFVLDYCGHNMFPQQDEEFENSAIPVVVDIAREVCEKTQ